MSNSTSRPDRQEIAEIFSMIMEDIFSVPESTAVEKALMRLAREGEVASAHPSVAALADDYEAARGSGDNDDREYRFLMLYQGLHCIGMGYSEQEAAQLKGSSGIANQPGGLLPVVAASRFMREDTVSGDLGAGNGLQGLLLQSIRPHAETRLVEMSTPMVEAGRMLTRALGLGARVRWTHGDITEQDLSGVGLVYIYRPAKPHGEGRALYEKLGQRLANAGGAVEVSVADCLGPYISGFSEEIYKDEYFTCFRLHARQGVS